MDITTELMELTDEQIYTKTVDILNKYLAFEGHDYSIAKYHYEYERLYEVCTRFEESPSYLLGAGAILSTLAHYKLLDKIGMPLFDTKLDGKIRIITAHDVLSMIAHCFTHHYYRKSFQEDKDILLRYIQIIFKYNHKIGQGSLETGTKVKESSMSVKTKKPTPKAKKVKVKVEIEDNTKKKQPLNSKTKISDKAIIVDETIVLPEPDNSNKVPGGLF